ARIAGIRLTREWIDDVANERKRSRAEHRVHEGRCGIRQEQHVRLMDVLEAADGRAVEADSVDEELAAQLTRRYREMLPRAGQVGEAQVDHCDPLIRE